MSDFEDDNPFRADGEDAPSENESRVVDLSAPSTPPSHPARILSPPTSSPPLNRTIRPQSIPHRPAHNAPKSEYCCAKDRWLHSGEDVEIQIVDAQKTSENSSSPYIAYVIRSGNTTSFHRYSEFESLRNNLTKLYPTLIIPPIPSKQTIGDYAAKQGRAKEDAALIARRKRMLQTFLNRMSRHPILSNEHVFHRFLDGEVSWTEVLHSPPITLIPKNILRAPAHNTTDTSSLVAYSALPLPSVNHTLRRPDQRFLDSEAFTKKFATHMSGPMEKVSRRTLKRWAELAQDHADLGAVLNGFSLNEQGPLSGALEKTGQAIDATYVSTTKMLQEHEQNWTEPLHEYTQFASIIRKLLIYRQQKHVQYELTQDALENKRQSIEELEKSEREARRLEEALGQGRPSRLSHSVSGGSSNGEEASAQTSNPRSDSNPASPASGAYGDPPTRDDDSPPEYLPPHPGPGPSRKRSTGMGLINALSYSLHGMMDVDPETARRNSITKTREAISQLEDALHLSARDLKYASTTIQADLDRFQRQKVADLREMALSMARSHRDMCKKNLEAWEEARKEIAQIPDHPNHIPDGVQPTSPVTSPRAGNLR